MSQDRTALYVGGGVLGLTLLALMSRKEETGPVEDEEAAPDESEVRGAAGFVPRPEDTLARHFGTQAGHGSLYQCKKGDIVLGEGQKSLCWRALKSAAQDCGLEDPGYFARQTDRKIAYARLLCAGNEHHLTAELHPKAFRNDEGLGLDVKKGPVVWMPLLDLEALSMGIVMPTKWEDGSSTVYLPPEVIEALAGGVL